MKGIKLFLTACLSLLILMQTTNLKAQTNITSQFPDPIFREYVCNLFGLDPCEIYDDNPNFATVTTIDVSNMDVTSINGVQYFNALETLDCSNNKLGGLPSLPATLKTLNCSFNEITGLPNFPNLEYLDCSNNQLPAMPPFPNTLTYLDCSHNQLPGLPDFPDLTYLDCSFNLLPGLPTFPDPLKYLNCSNNILPGLPDLTNLVYLNCSNNQLTGLPVFPITLEHLDCSYNLLTGLHWMVSLPLTYFNCSGNQLTALHLLPATLKILDCSFNQLAGDTIMIGWEDPVGTWNGRNLPAGLESLYCSYNLLKGLKVTGLNNLSYLDCRFNDMCDKSDIRGLNESITTTLLFLSQQDSPKLEVDGIIPAYICDETLDIKTIAGCKAGTRVLAKVKLIPDVSDLIKVTYLPDLTYTDIFELEFVNGEVIFDPIALPNGFELGDRTARFFIKNTRKALVATDFAVNIILFEVADNTNIVAELTVPDMVIRQNPSFELLSAPETENQIVRVNTPMNEINYLIKDMPGVFYPGFPPGVWINYDNLTNILRIYNSTVTGGPSVVGDYNPIITVGHMCSTSWIDWDTMAYIFLKIVPCDASGIVEDKVNGDTYDIIPLEGLCWLKQNTHAKLYQDGSAIPYAKPYLEDAQNETNFGLLYTHAAATAKQICPPGWHIPTVAEWELLTPLDGKKLMNKDFWVFPNYFAADPEFDIRGAGYFCDDKKAFVDKLAYTAFWSSDPPSATACKGLMLSCNCPAPLIVDIPTSNAISVRCVEN